MNRTQMILAPISVLVFVLILTVMYGWVDTIENFGEERPEINTANLQTPGQAPSMQPGSPPQLVNNPTFPSGIGNGQIQLINNPTFPSGIGNGQIKLINQVLPGAPYLGLTLREVPKTVSADLKLPPKTGVYVKNVTSLSPAGNAGIKLGDIVLKCDHKPIRNHEEVGRIVAAKKVGDVIKFLVNRNGRKKSFHVKLGKAPSGLVQVAGVEKKIWLGADIQDIDAIMKMQFSLPDNRGVIVSHVSPNSPASAAGLINGDVIRRFNNTRVRDVTQLQSLVLKQQPGKQVQLIILRNQNQQTLTLVMGERTPIVPKIPFLGPADIAIEGTWIGMDVGELTANGATSYGLPPGTRGILVNDVESPPATMVGFQTGDILTAINGEPTPDMKHFQAATKKQTSAVVDVIRGNKHFFISVPPPGLTQQGTTIHTGIDNKIKKVALTRAQAIPGQSVPASRIGIFSSGPDVNASVIGNSTQNPFLIMVDLTHNSFAVLDPNALGNIGETFRQQQLSALVAGSISRQAAADLSAKGVTLYTGVVGTVNNTISLYESGCLTPARGY